jgi:hypothetical protein
MPSVEVSEPVDHLVSSLSKQASAPGPPRPSAATAVRPQTESGSCGCSRCSGGEEVPATFVYALGRIEPRFPSLGIEKEFAQATGRAITDGLNDRQALHTVLTERVNRYLARQVCWVLTIEGMETYMLQAADPSELDLLVESIRPAPRATDIDVVIGVRGEVAPPEMCNGLIVPIVRFQQIYSFDIDGLLGSIPCPPGADTAKFKSASEDLFTRIVQVTDNAGATDEDRALNFLALRYPALYAHASDCFNRNQTLTSVETRSSTVGPTRKLVDVIMTYSDRKTDVADKYFVRVDVTEMFPFLVTKLTPFVNH